MPRAFVALIGLTLAITACSDSATPAGDSGPAARAGEPEGTQTFSDLSQDHVDGPVDYPQTPPVGGPHSADWQTCGVYTTEFPKERGVHSMEHGAVWITYSSDLPATEVAVLQQLAANGKEVLVSPYTGLPTPVVASAWGKQLQLQTVNDPRLAEFVAYFDDGPQTPEKDTPCAQGTTDTG